MATLSRISVHPIKSLDPESVEAVDCSPIGGLVGDRMYAVVDVTGNYVNGKRTAAVHGIRTNVDLETGRLSVREEGDDDETHFDLPEERSSLESWLSSWFDFEVELVEASGGGFTDGVVYGETDKPGPTIISRATLAELASWYDGISPGEMRRRLRPNLVVDGVPAFWEDRLFADTGRSVRIGDVTLEGTRPIPRCVVPTRDSRTGDEYDDFQRTFVERRKETLPAWTDRDAFNENFYSVMAGLRIPESERDGSLQVGDSVELLIDGEDES